ncbi:RICIN domain-containing protein [Amycolatopsis sp. NPDC059021]|uniref:RICIN domain-containing protein n=1 Tax=Amycolatopsis sp. NPDC059021 TaxID=3346704 RepID=UPI00366B2A03
MRNRCLALVAGLFFTTLVVSQQVSTAEPAPSASVAESRRAEILGKDWKSSGDRMWTTVGDGRGFHVMTADARTGYSWRTIATLARPGLDADSWIGNACLTASGQRLVVVYAPRTFTNQEELFDRGGFTAIVDLNSGVVTPVPVHTSLAYFNPGCGADERVALTQATAEKTGVLVLDASNAKLSPRIELPGQGTSAVPAGDDILVAALGRIEKVTRQGKRTAVAATSGIAHRLRPDSGGGVVFSEQEKETSRIRRLAGGVTSTLATGKIGEVDTTTSGGGNVFITGTAKAEQLPAEVRKLDAPAGSRVSTSGELALVGQVDPLASPGAPEKQQTRMEARSTKTGKTAKFAVEPTPARSTASIGAVGTSDGLHAMDTTIDDSPCSVERNNPNRQVYQPSPRQVEWAANWAVFGQLLVERSAGWKNNGLTDPYKPQNLVPPGWVNDDANARVPVQILLGVLGQESNLWQAKRHVLPGQTGNPLVGNYYGVDYYNDTTADDWTINWDKADCGYGVGQVTDGMRKPGRPHPKNRDDAPRQYSDQVAIATDYAVNVAAALQILISKWNQLQRNHMTINNNDPSKIENWFYALWAYNSGYHYEGEPGTNGAKGLGWANNPVNPKYDVQRAPFGKNPRDFATPQRWPYPEKVIGFASNPPSGYEFPGAEVPFFRAASWLGGDINGPINRDKAKPPVTQFCNDSNMCYPDRPKVSPNAPEVIGEPMGPCYHQNPAGQYDLKCWFSESSVWKPDCATTCGVEFLRFWDQKGTYKKEEPLRRDKNGNRIDGISYPPRCDTRGLPTGFLLIDNVPYNTPAISEACTKIESSGSFDMTYGHPSARIDLHQVGGGYGAHFWWSENKPDLSPNPTELRITGTWTLNRKLGAPAKIWVHVPDHLAEGEATYEVDTAWGTMKRTIRQKDAAGLGLDGKTTTSGNRWVYLGGFMFDDKKFPTVRLSNLSRVNPIAYDAIAFAPMVSPEMPDDQVAVIYNQATGKCLTIKDNSMDDFAPAIQRDCANTFTDQWILRWQYALQPGTPVFKVINRNSGRCLAVQSSRIDEPLAPAMQIDCNRGSDYNLHWAIADLGPYKDGTIFPPYGSLVLWVGSYDNGEPVVMGGTAGPRHKWFAEFLPQ